MSIILNHVNHIYNMGTSYEAGALVDVNLEIKEGEFVAVIGHTGSGKSTLIQMMNGLIKPTSGEIYYNGADIWDKNYNRVELRGKVGMVFQYPEHQLFETSVIKDVCFGPENIGMDTLKVQLNSYNALKMVGIDESLIDCSPFELSGGQKRRVAIAGILAMEPEVLILDEPTAGLDAAGRKQILTLLKELNEKNMTIIMVSHNMEDVAMYADRVVVVNDGRIVLDGDKKSVFSQVETLRKIGLDVPQVAEVFLKMRDNGVYIEDIPLTVDEAFDMIARR